MRVYLAMGHVKCHPTIGPHLDWTWCLVTGSCETHFCLLSSYDATPHFLWLSFLLDKLDMLVAPQFLKKKKKKMKWKRIRFPIPHFDWRVVKLVNTKLEEQWKEKKNNKIGRCCSSHYALAGLYISSSWATKEWVG